MTNPADFRVATCNAKKELGPNSARSVVAKAAQVADVIGWQEIETAAHRQAVADLPGFITYWPGGSAKASSSNAVPVSYRKSRFHAVSVNRKKLSPGIFKVSPARWAVKVVLEDQVTGQRVAIVNCHLISQAFTSHRSRRPVWTRAARILTKWVGEIVSARHALVGTGDMNRNKWAPAGTLARWTVHGTCGSQHYDTIYRAGSMTLVEGPSRIETASDHDILVATFRRTK